MEQTLSLEFLRVVEQAAIACASSIGHGRRKHSDKLAVEAMRTAMESVRMDGTIVIGEGERDEAPMLYIGEKVGMGADLDGDHPAVDIAVDPLEGTNLCATGAPNAIAVLAATEKGGLLHAPDLYMEKLVVGPAAKGKVSLDAPVGETLKIIAKSATPSSSPTSAPPAPASSSSVTATSARPSAPPSAAPASTQSWERAAPPRACSPPRR